MANSLEGNHHPDKTDDWLIASQSAAYADHVGIMDNNTAIKLEILNVK